MAQKEIKNVNKKSLAKIMAFIYGLIGFFIALIVAIANLTSFMTQQNFTGSVFLVTLLNIGVGLLLGVLSALLTALIGWIVGYIMAGIYNWFAKKAGGVKVELSEIAEVKNGEASRHFTF